jgi:rhomboid protease GluP
LATDGDIDFRAYSREQLDGAIGRMDRERYPVNYRNLVAEYRRRSHEEAEIRASAARAAGAEPERIQQASESAAAIEFAIAFGPSAGSGWNVGLGAWLTQSRNDFDLVGSGTLRDDGVGLTLTGRRGGGLMGAAFKRQVRLERKYIVNVECDGNVIRFEYRVPDESIPGLMIWLADPAGALRLAKTLPAERTADFSPRLLAHIEFERFLIAQSPKTPVTYGLVALNVLVYLAAVLGTHHWLNFDSRLLISLGSNYGPYTADGEWWRLLTSMFLHAGLFHLVFNMWALASFGPAVERLFGSVSYAAIYFLAGLVGGLASISWRPDIDSVGASGAIFGILGALIAVALLQRKTIPFNILRPLRNSSLIFTGYALLSGFGNAGIDNAAHIGGLSAGFLIGAFFSRRLTEQRPSRHEYILRYASAAPLAVFLIGVGIWCARISSTHLSGAGLLAKTLHWYTPRESEALARWNTLQGLAHDGKLNDAEIASRVSNEVLPFWREADARFAGIELLPSSPSFRDLELLQSVAQGRLHSYRILEEGLRRHDAHLVASFNQEQRRVDALIAEGKGTEDH